MADPHFKEALEHYQRGQYQEALQGFDSLSKAYPQRSEVWLNLGNAQFQMNMNLEAEKNWKHAVDINPMEATAYLNLGNLYFANEQWGRAIHFWEQFIQLKPTHAAARLNMALALEQSGKLVEAMAHYQKFMSLSPTSKEAMQIKTRFATAQKTYEKNMGIAERSLKQGKLEHACKAFEASFSIYPGNAAAHKAHATALYQQDRLDEALEAYRIAQQQKPEDVGILTNMGVIYERKQQHEDALWCYLKASQLGSPEKRKLQQRISAMVPQCNFQAYLEQALSHLSRGQFQSTREQLQCLLDMHEYCPELKAEITHQQTRIEEMHDPKKRAAKVYYALGEQARENGRYDQALSFYNRYLEVAPQGPHAGEVTQKKAGIQSQMGAVISSMLGQGGKDNP